MAGDPVRSRGWRLEHSWWIILAAISFGWLVWAPFAYLGARTHTRRWLAWAAVYFVLGASGFTLLVASAVDTWQAALGTILTLVAWVGGFLHALAIRENVLEQLSVEEDPRIRRARSRMTRRFAARELATHSPKLAVEAGIGRDANTFGGLIDVNHAPAEELARLPGFSLELARRVVHVREEIDGFSSVLDFGTVLDLPPHLVDELRDRVVCLPR